MPVSTAIAELHVGKLTAAVTPDRSFVYRVAMKGQTAVAQPAIAAGAACLPVTVADNAPDGEPAFCLADGASVQRTERGVEIIDQQGRVMVRYADGCASILAPAGDLMLAAPNGRVVLRSGGEHGQAASEISLGADGVVTKSERIELRAQHTRVISGSTEMLSRQFSIIAGSITQQAERYELRATRLVEKARDAFRDVSDLAQSRAGRWRTFVEDVYSLKSRRTILRSDSDTSIDGKRIQLG